LEKEQEMLQAAMADPAFYKQDKQAIVARQKRLEELEAQIAAGYQRWEALDAWGR
jgi:ABC transport system ATP-binding/permease protein